MRCIDLHYNGQIVSFCFLRTAEEYARELGLTHYTILCRGHYLVRV